MDGEPTIHNKLGIFLLIRFGFEYNEPYLKESLGVTNPSTSETLDPLMLDHCMATSGDLDLQYIVGFYGKTGAAPFLLRITRLEKIFLLAVIG
ncbi:hypothetical protein V6N13_067779 [Hibiscus sabdariffa]